MQTRLEAVLWLTVIAHNILVLSVGCWPIPQSQLSLQLGFKHHLCNSSWDIPEQREALLSLYTTTNGSQWVDPATDGSPISANESWSWGSRNTSYCSWPGILCCRTAQLAQQLLTDLQFHAEDSIISCRNGTDVLGLFLSEAGLQGMLPDILQLPALRVLMLGANPGLKGSWPATLQLPQLQTLDVHNTSLSVCLDSNNGSHTPIGSECELPPWLSYGTITADQNSDPDGLLCPQLTIHSMGQQQLGSSVLEAFLGLLHIDGIQGMNTVRYSAGFTRAHGCACAAAGEVIRTPPNSSSTNNSIISHWRCEAVASGKLNGKQLAFVIAFVAVATALLGCGYWFLDRGGAFGRLWACLTGKVDSYAAEQKAAAAAANGGEMSMVAKRSRFPGTPSIALAKGRGVISVSEVLVTWVVTDVEGSTQLWEWDPVVMAAAVDQHNIVLRSLLDQHGGHEVRTDGDSFTLAFHDAADAVAYCIQAQEELLEVPWPKRLSEHPYCANVRLGEVCATRHPDAAAEVLLKGGIPLEKQGPLVMNGLRVRMGINTGVPDDIFVHDLTQHVEYRGDEYNLTDDLAGMAAGGQILMGPKTFQRWNRVFSHAAMPADGDVQVHLDDASPALGVQAEAGDSSGRQHWHTHQQKSGSMLRRTFDSVAGFLVGASAKSFTANTPVQNPMHATGHGNNEGSCHSMENELLVSGGDTLLVYNSQGGTQTVAIGRTPDEAATAADADAGGWAGIYEGHPWPNGSNSTNQHVAEHNSSTAAAGTGPEQPDDNGLLATDVRNGSFCFNKNFVGQYQPHPPAQPAATESRSAIQKIPPLVRSKTAGSISFAINTAGSGLVSAHTAAASGLHIVAAGAAAQHPKRRNNALVGLELAAFQPENRAGLMPGGTVGIKSPSYVPQVAKHVSFTSSKPGAVGASHWSTKEKLQPLQGSTGPVSDSPGPIAEAVEPQAIPTVASSVTAMHDANSVEANAVVKVFRRISASVGSFVKGGALDAEHEGASYLVSTNGSSNSTQQTRMGSKYAHSRSRSSIWGSVGWKSDTNLGDGQRDGNRSFERSNAVLIDLGYYQWRPDEPSQHPGLARENAGDAELQTAAAEAAPGGLLHLVQVQSHRLAPRMLLFDWPLEACEGQDAILQQLLPGFFDAPGASSLMFTSMRSLMELAGAAAPAKPEVAIAFVSPAGLKEVQALGAEMYQACQSLFTCVVREVLLAVGGYESKEVGGQVLAAFETPAQAVEWALALQCALLQAPWPVELAQLPCTATIAAPKQDTTSSQSDNSAVAKPPNSTQNPEDKLFYNPGTLFRGVRARVGIWSGPMDRVLPHGKSGRADYLGPPANRAARMMGAAQGGQVLVEEGIMQQVLQEWQTSQEQKAHAALVAAAVPSTPGSSTQAPASMHTSSTPGSASTVSAERDLQMGSPNVANTPEFSEGLPSTTAASRLLHNSSVLLTSKRGRRRTKQEGVEGSAGPAAGRNLNASLLASFKRNPPRPLLFENVLDSAALFGPATTALHTPARSRRIPAPWDAFPDDPAATWNSASTSPRTSPPPQMHVDFAGVPTAHSEGDSAQQPGMLRLQLPASLGPSGAPQVLTIAPAAYQPRGGGPGQGETRSVHSTRTTRSTGSSTGGVIVSPPTHVMKGRKSLSIAVNTRPSMDAPIVGASTGVGPMFPRQPVAVRQSFEHPDAMTAAAGVAEGANDPARRRTSLSVQSAAMRRRSIQFGSQLVDTDELYSAVEAALGAPNAPHPAHVRGKRRTTLLDHKQPSSLQEGQLPAANQPVQDNVVTAMSSAFYSAAVIDLKKPPVAASAATLGHCGGDNSQLCRAADRGAVDSVSSSVEHMPSLAEATFGPIDSSSTGSDDVFLSQLLPTSAFIVAPGKAQLDVVTTGSSACSSPQQRGAVAVHSDSCLSPAPSSARSISSAASSGFKRRSTKELLETIEEQVRSLTAGHTSSCDRGSAGTEVAAGIPAGCTHGDQQANLSESLSTCSKTALRCQNSEVRRSPQLNHVMDDPDDSGPCQSGPPDAQAGEMTADSGRVLGREQKCQSMSTDPEGRLGRSMLHNVTFPAEACDSKQPISLQGSKTSVLAGSATGSHKQASTTLDATLVQQQSVGLKQQICVQLPEHQKPGVTSGSGSNKSSGIGSQYSSSSGRRHKEQRDNTLWQIADSLRSVRLTGSISGSTVSRASTGGRSEAHATQSSISRDGAALTAGGTQTSSKKPTKSHEGARSARSAGEHAAAEGLAAGIAGVWEAFTNAIRSTSGSRATSGSGGTAAMPFAGAASASKGSVLENHPSADADAAHNKHQSSSSTPRDATKPGIIAECFKITPAAAPGDTGESLESITMIKYTAFKQQADALDAVQEALIIAPGIAAAAAAAGAYSRANSTAGTSASLGSSVKLPRWPQICVDVSVYRVGGFRLKGVDNVVDVVQVTPSSMVARMEYIPPPCTKGKSQCVAPATGLVMQSKAFLPDLSQLIDWMAAPLLPQQQAWTGALEQQLPQPQEESDWLQREQSRIFALQQEQASQDMYPCSATDYNQVSVCLRSSIGAVQEPPGIHSAGCGGNEASPSFSIKAYHGPIARPWTSSEDGHTPLSVILSSGNGSSAVAAADQEARHTSSMPGDQCQEHACSVLGRGSLPHLPNYVPSHSGSTTTSTTPPLGPFVQPAVSAASVDDAGWPLSRLKGPTLLQAPTLQEDYPGT